MISLGSGPDYQLMIAPPPPPPPPNKPANFTRSSAILQAFFAAETDANGNPMPMQNPTPPPPGPPTPPPPPTTDFVPMYDQLVCKDESTTQFHKTRCAGVFPNGAYFFSDTLFGNNSIDYTFIDYQKSLAAGKIAQTFSISYWRPFKPETVYLGIFFLVDNSGGPGDASDPWVQFDNTPIPQDDQVTTQLFSSDQSGVSSTFSLTSSVGLITTVTLFNFAFDSSNSMFNITHQLAYTSNSSNTFVTALIPVSKALPFFS